MKRRIAAVGAAVVLAVLAGSAPSAVAEDGPAEGRTVFAVMNGAREVNALGQRHQGDPNGFGSFTGEVVNGNQLCYGMTVSGIDTPTAAHIHRAPKTAPGPVVVPLPAIPTSGDPGTASGCVMADPALLTEIVNHPRRFYVNVHNQPYPAGAIRGQLFKGS